MDDGTQKRKLISEIKLGQFNNDQNWNNYTHPTHDGDDIDIDTTALTGATVISDLDLNITTDTLGHVTDANASIATRNLTLADLGFTGDADATDDQTAAEITALLNDVASYTLGTNSGTITVGNDLTVTGDLLVSGDTVTINTATVEVEDNILQLNTTQGSPDTATATTSGISIYRGNGVTQASFIFDDADDTWDLTNNLTLGGVLTATNAVLTTPNLGTPSAINLSNATNAPTWNQDTTGNAATVTVTLDESTNANNVITFVRSDGTLAKDGNLRYNPSLDTLTAPTIQTSVNANLKALSLNSEVQSVNSIKDEDNMASNSDSALATQQSIKAYVDNNALMDSEVTNLAQVKAFDSSDYATAAQGTKADSAQQPPSEGAFVNGDKTKLDGIEASADVTDTANVKTALGAAMPNNALTIGDGNTAVSIPGNLTVTGTVTTNNVETVSTSNGVIFEGSTDDEHETTLVGGNPTEDITLTLPTSAGTLALSGASVNYSQLTGTAPTWNQNTTGTAAGLSSTLAISSGGTGATSAPMIGVITAANAGAARSALGLGTLATLSSVAGGQIDANAVDSSELKDGAVQESHLDVTNAAGSGTDNYLLSYNHAGQNFTWVAPVSAGISLDALSVGSEASPSGDGGIAYDDTTGVFTYTPPLNITGNAATITVSANNTTDETVYLLFADGAFGSKGAETDAQLYYNPSNNTLNANVLNSTNVITTTASASTSLTTPLVTNSNAVSITTTANNGNIALSPHGTGQIREKGLKTKTGTYVETRHPDTGTPAASNATYAQTHGITKVQGSQSQFGTISNGSAISVTGVLPSGSISAGSCGYRAIRGTIHIDAGLTSNNIVMTQDFIANARTGNGGFTFTSYGMVFDGQTDPPFLVAWDEVGTNDMPLKIINQMGTSTTNTLRVWWDLTLFPQV